MVLTSGASYCDACHHFSGNFCASSALFSLTTALYFFFETGLLCVGIELLIRHYLGAPLRLVWSAVVLTVCGVIVMVLLTTLSRRRLRDAVRRRLHF